MEFYFFQLAILFLYYIFTSIFIEDTRHRNNFFLLITFVHLFILQAFRSLNFGSDDWYQDLYLYMNRITWKDLLTNHIDVPFKAEYGYIVLNKILYTLFSNVQTIYIVVSFIYLISFCHTCKRYSPYPMLSVLVFYVVFWFQSFYVLRQYLAVALCLFSLPYIFNREWKKFSILMFLAFVIHQSSILFAFTYILYPYMLRMNLKNIILIWGSTFIITLFFTKILELLVESYLMGYYAYLEYNIGGDYESGGNFKMFVLYSGLLICYILFVRKKKETFEENFFFKMMVIATIIQLTGSQFGFIQRFNIYYAFASVFVIPTIIKHIKVKGIRFSVIIFISLLYLYVMYNDFVKERYFIVPYESILF